MKQKNYIRTSLIIIFIALCIPTIYAQDIEQKISLDGIWKFKADYYNKGETQIWYHNNFDDTGWDKLNVPGNWDIRNEYSEFSGKGWYRTTFQSPDGVEQKNVHLSFEAVGTDYKVWLNNELIGVFIGGFLSHDFDLTGKLKQGQKNCLVVCADNSFRCGAYWNWGGIRRPVTLVINNSLFIESVKVISVPDLQKGSAKVTIDAAIHNGDKITDKVDLFYSLSLAGKVIKKGFSSISLNGSVSNLATFEFILPKKDVKLWHFDFPNLYSLKVSIIKGNTIAHEANERFGIRKLELKDGKFLLNGESIRVMGFNWVADERLTGNTLPADLYKRDIDNMKSLGANMARLSHFPLPKEVYDYLDEKGMLIVAEIPLWGTTKLTEPENPIAKSWLKLLVNTNFNHPSIISWSVGNEIGDKIRNPKVMEYVENAIKYVKDSLDHSRYVVMVSHTANSQKEDPSKYADFVLYNSYGSWGKNIDKVHEFQPNKMIFLSECGEHLIGEDLNTATGNFTKMINELKGREYFFGASLWTYNDYRSNYRSGNPTWDSKVSQNRDWGIIDGYGNKKKAYNIIRREFAPLKCIKVGQNQNSLEVNIQPREKLDLPAFPLHEYKLVCEEFGTDDKVSQRTEIILPAINPGDASFNKTFDLKTTKKAVASRRIFVVNPTGYMFMDTTIYYVAPQKPFIKSVFNNGTKIRVVFDPVKMGTEYKLLYGENELNQKSTNSIDNFIEVDNLTDSKNLEKTYQIQLVAVNNFGESKSNIYQEKISSFSKLPPVIKAVRAFQNGISIGYSTEKEEYLYKIQYSTSPDFSKDTYIIQTTTKGACYIPDLTPGIKYYIRMSSVEQYEIQSSWSESYAITI
ncbi:MAG: beta galactosidase jelly roll domain-containing protein [Bacteroidetes bacterium]|nr:beta galactosidase jelly roll domain-containing protein [Bacteroidota bacterium]